MFQLVNMLYNAKNKDNKKSTITIVRKDAQGNKDFHYVENLKFKYFFNKPEYQNEGMVEFIEPSKVNCRICEYDSLYKDIAYNVLPDLKNFYLESMSSGEGISSKLKRLHLDYRLHGSDKNIVDSYITNFYKKYDPNKNMYGLTKSFVDIEVDGSQIVGFPNPEEALAPINVITLVCENGHVYSFCLKYNTDTYREAMESKQELIETLEERYKDTNLNLKFDIREFDNELDLIQDFFDVINIIEKPDFCLAWNAPFDFTTIINRIKNLGGDPETICCPKELKYKKAWINLDKMHSDPADKTDTFEIGGYTVWLDQLAIFANLRKSAKEDSYALDYIGGKYLDIHKDKVEGDIKTFHFVDYKKFLLYNIQDAVMLLQLENKVKDIDLFYQVSVLTETRITHALKKTVCLRNLADKFYRERNLIISNNRAKLWNNGNTKKIKGASMVYVKPL